MEKRLKRFETDPEYEANLKSSEYAEPQVSYVKTGEKCYYDDIIFKDPAVRKAIGTAYFGNPDKKTFWSYNIEHGITVSELDEDGNVPNQ